MQNYPRCVLCVLIRYSRMSVHTHNTKVSSKSLSCIDVQNRTTKTKAERCHKMHRRGGLSCPIWLVSCSPILAMYFYLLCRSRHSSQTCIGICRFRKQADVLVTTTPKSKKFQIEATLLRNRGDLPSVTLVEQVLRDVCRFVSATQHACNIGYEQTFSRRHMHEKQMRSNDQVGHRRMIIDMMPIDTLARCNCSRSVPSETHRFSRIDTQAKCENARRFTNTEAERCQKYDRGSALFLLSYSPICN